MFVSPQVRGKTQSSRSLISDGLQELTLEQKLYVAQREVAETKRDQTRVQQRYEKIQDDYKVRTLEDTHEFEFSRHKIQTSTLALSPAGLPEGGRAASRGNPEG